MKMRKYYISDASVQVFPKIDNKENINFMDISRTTEQSATHAKSRTEYPNGLIIETVSTIDGAEITTNWVIIKGENGQLYFAEPILEIE